MRIAYIHGYDGVTGPLLLGACLDAGVSLQTVQEGWQQLHWPVLQVSSQRLPYASGMATQVHYSVAAESLRFLQTSAGLTTSVAQSDAPPRVKQRMARLLERFAQAVAYHQGEAVSPEPARPSPWLPELLYLGSAVAFALEALEVEQVMAAPIPLSTGVVAHGAEREPHPHPLTVALSRGVPVYGVDLSTEPERTTVSGAALLTAWAERFGPLPNMTIAKTGYGVVNGLAPGSARGMQLVVGETTGPAVAERIAVIEANIDDMNPEFYECVAERLFAHGALDVTLTPLFMKKNRPANTLTVLAPVQAVTTLASLILQETSTFGVRVHEVWRHKLDRFHRQVETRYGPIPVKCGVLEGRIVQAAPEYDACKRVALERGVPVRLVYAEAASVAAPWLAT